MTVGGYTGYCLVPPRRPRYVIQRNEDEQDRDQSLRHDEMRCDASVSGISRISRINRQFAVAAQGGEAAAGAEAVEAGRQAGGH